MQMADLSEHELQVSLFVISGTQSTHLTNLDSLQTPRKPNSNTPHRLQRGIPTWRLRSWLGSRST